MDPYERANREAELAHELELLKAKLNEHQDAIHTIRNRMQQLVLRLSSIRKGGEDPGS